MSVKNNLRVWAVWDRQINRIEFLSQSNADCRKVLKMLKSRGISSLELLRFDLCYLYKDKD